jgi:hypothetical protein
VRLDFFFEEPLHSGGVLGGAAVSQCTTNLSRDVGRSDFAHRIQELKKAAW